MKLQLSSDLLEISAEINIWKQQAGHAVFEIGRRLKHVKENDLVHGQWESWLKSIDFDPSTARRMIMAADQFGNHATSHELPTGKIFEMLSLPESVDRQEFIQSNHVIPSTGEIKQVDEMTVKELREVKKSLQEAEQRAAQAEATAVAEQNSKRHFEKLWQQAKNQPPKVETKTVEVVPDHVQRELQQSKYKIEGLERQLEQTKNQLESSESLKKSYEKDSKEYADLKGKISFLEREKDDLHRKIESATALSGLAVEIDNFLKTKLAPTRYSRALERMDSEVAVRNLSDMLAAVESWCADMRQYLPKGNRIIVRGAEYDDVS